MLFGITVACAAWLGLSAPAVSQGERFLLVSPLELTFLIKAGDTSPIERVIHLASTGEAIRWTAVISPSVAWLSLSASQGIAPPVETGDGDLRVFVASTGQPSGVYSTTIELSADTTVLNTPVNVPIQLIVAEELRYVYLPLISVSSNAGTQ